MKIVYLNVWHGKILDRVTKFIQEQSIDTDIFCFQEFSDEMIVATADSLSCYDEISARKPLENGEFYSLAIFMRKDFQRMSSGVLLGEQTACGFAVYAEIQFGANKMYVCNVHGISKPGEKLDTPDRLNQSQIIVDFFKEKKCPIVIGGDFNLFPDTKSMRMFEENGYKNLIKDFKIKTTRNHYVWDRYPNNPYRYSDYVLINSKSLDVKDFIVPNIKVSDHLPLILSIESKTN